MSDNDQGQVHYRVEEGIAWLTFDRESSRNAMTWHMYDRLEAHCQAIEQDPDIVAVVMRGAGGEAFVAGTDIKQFANFSSGDDAIAYERRIDQLVGRVERLPLPTLALLEGFCVGGGAAIALACDFRYATPSLKFGIPIARTLGNCLSITNVARLVEHAGVARAKQVMMAGELIRADEALSAGLVAEVVPAEEIEALVAERAAAFKQRAPLTVKAAKQVIQRVLDEKRAPHDGSDDWITACYTSEDFRAAVNKFVNKTPFSWKGR
uniref:enoyl-CoA hydratase/isomerase family protein n=1 Tax=Halomonas sp. TaxID=1486246 RepID=UPI002623008F|nr:enoyl-CoA hydratase/isomerase family protein [Halomonas sp.]